MAKQKSMKGKGYYATYRTNSQAEKNRAARLARHLKRHPEDDQAAKSAKKSKTPRSKPLHKGNYPKAIDYALVGTNGFKERMPNKFQENKTKD